MYVSVCVCARACACVVGLHFRWNGHYSNRDKKFTIIERIAKDINVKQIFEKEENKRMKSLQTNMSFEFNMKLNHPALK